MSVGGLETEWLLSALQAKDPRVSSDLVQYILVYTTVLLSVVYFCISCRIISFTIAVVSCHSCLCRHGISLFAFAHFVSTRFSRPRGLSERGQVGAAARKVAAPHACNYWSHKTQTQQPFSVVDIIDSSSSNSNDNIEIIAVVYRLHYTHQHLSTSTHTCISAHLHLR
jgi:hypothetical protein